MGRSLRYSNHVMYEFWVEAARRAGNLNDVRWDLKALYCCVETGGVNLALGDIIDEEPNELAAASTPKMFE